MQICGDRDSGVVANGEPRVSSGFASIACGGSFLSVWQL